MAVAAAAGLSGVLLAVPSLQLAMRAAGSLYLLWLGWQIASWIIMAAPSRGCQLPCLLPKQAAWPGLGSSPRPAS